jgi:hypothetical protein
MAVQTVMLVATYFGEQEINWGTADEKRQGLIVSILMLINFPRQSLLIWLKVIFYWLLLLEKVRIERNLNLHLGKIVLIIP